MVKTPRTQRSKLEREPVTIELAPDAVSRAPVEEQPIAATGVADIAAPEPVADAPVAGPNDGMAQADPSASITLDVPATEPSSVKVPLSETKAFERPGGYDFRDEPAPDSTADGGKPAGPAKPSSTAPSSRDGTAMNRDAKAPASKRSLASLLAAGVVCGVIALAGAGLLSSSGLFGAGNGVDSSADIAALRSEVEALKAAPAGDLAQRIDSLSTAVDQAKTDIATLQSAGGGDPAGLAALDERLKALEAATGAPAQAGGDIASFDDRIAGLEALVKAAGEANTAADGRLGALEASVAGITSRIDAQSAQPKVALSIAGAALNSAVERGAPFEAELDTLVAIAPDVEQLAALRPFAQSGVPSRATIAGEAEAAATAIIAAGQTADDSGGGFFDSLLSSAQSLVSVRPVGEVAGPGVPETAARMQVAAEKGDLARALGEYDSLPEPAKAAGAAFAEKLRARVEVERLADQAISAALQAA